MATVKNFGLAGIGSDVQFGKSGGRLISHEIWAYGNIFWSGPPASPFFDKCFLDFDILGPLNPYFDQLDR